VARTYCTIPSLIQPFIDRKLSLCSPEGVPLVCASQYSGHIDPVRM
jgi:hypothetical protein